MVFPVLQEQTELQQVFQVLPKLLVLTEQVVPQVQTELQQVLQVLTKHQVLMEQVVLQVLMVLQVLQELQILQVFHSLEPQVLVVVRLLTNQTLLLKLQEHLQYKVYRSFQFQVLH